MIALLVAAMGGLVTTCLILSDDRAASASRSTASRSASAKNRMGELEKAADLPARVKADRAILSQRDFLYGQAGEGTGLARVESGT